MKYSISNIAWSAENDAEMYSYLQRVKFCGLEIAPTRIFPKSPYNQLSQAEDWANQLREEYGLSISSMQSIWYGREERIFGSEKERNILLEYTHKACRFAQTIKCKNLVFGCPRNRETLDVAGDYPIAIDFFHALGEMALESDTIIAIEPNPTIYNTHFLNYTEQVVDFVYKAQSEGLRVNYDLGSAIYNEEDINYLKEVSSLINHVHISEPWLNLIEKREVHRQLLSLLKNANYIHSVSIEMSNRGDLQKVKDSIDYLNEINEK